MQSILLSQGSKVESQTYVQTFSSFFSFHPITNFHPLILLSFLFVFMFSCGKGALLSYLDEEKVPFY
ncbi:transmembrane protein, putative [Medicago truncatula]|uniref:Transmembrane protein, putative n=1 Tax=Medicago truncatula TaxID=3880 RepID=G7JEC1_MEDTR|nr:transmembrane protein, putative [Medicago truncatula]